MAGSFDVLPRGTETGNQGKRDGERIRASWPGSNSAACLMNPRWQLAHTCQHPGCDRGVT